MEKGQKTTKAKVRWIQWIKDWFTSKRLLSDMSIQVESYGRIKPKMGKGEICKVGREICRRAKESVG